MINTFLKLETLFGSGIKMAINSLCSANNGPLSILITCPSYFNKDLQNLYYCLFYNPCCCNGVPKIIIGIVNNIRRRYIFIVPRNNCILRKGPIYLFKVYFIWGIYLIRSIIKKYEQKKISEFNSNWKFTVCYFFHLVAHSGIKIKNAVNCSISHIVST